jgi:hypothetical protein
VVAVFGGTYLCIAWMLGTEEAKRLLLR